MILYAVDNPPCEDEGDGEDNRQWYSTKAAAVVRYRELVRQAKEYEAARAKRDACESDTDEWDAAHEAVQSHEASSWKFVLIKLELYDIPTTREALAKALNRQLYGCRKTLASYGEPVAA